jgi:hypothetical protein
MTIVTDAFRKIGVCAHDEALTADMEAAGMRELRRMLLSWQNLRYNLWLTTEASITLTTAVSYVLPERALRVHSVRYRNASGIDLPINPMTRQEYYDLPIKTSTGIPHGWYYDRQVATGTLYIWQPLASVTTETLKVTYERPFDEDDLLDDIPPEWENAVLYGLAAQLATDYDGKDVTMEASGHLAAALASDREDSIYFGEPCD